MRFKDLTEQDKIDIIEGLEDGVNSEAMADSFKVNRRTIYKWRDRILDDVEKDDIEAEEEKNYLSEEQRQIHKLKKENKTLKKSINDVKENLDISDSVKSLIYDIKDIGFDKEPKWIKQKQNKTNILIPVLCLSDMHLGEVVRAEEVNYVNEYNSDIAEIRINDNTDDFIDIAINKMSNYSYPGVVLILPGDGITGALHDLPEFNDNQPIQQVIQLTNILTQQIKKLEVAFGKVSVFAVTGNHGRLAKYRTKTKGRTGDSLETIAYHFINEHFKDNKNVSVVYNESDEIYFKLNDRRFLLQHGDSFKGGGGISGPLMPIKRGRARKLEAANAMNKAFDTMILGHWHFHHISDDIIICNSTKGYDEYVKSLMIPFSSPGSTSFFINSSSDIIYATNIKCRDGVNKKKKISENHISIF